MIYFHDTKVRVIISNKEIPNVDVYLKLKSKYGPLVGYIQILSKI